MLLSVEMSGEGPGRKIRDRIYHDLPNRLGPCPGTSLAARACDIEAAERLSRATNPGAWARAREIGDREKRKKREDLLVANMTGHS